LLNMCKHLKSQELNQMLGIRFDDVTDI